MHRLPLVTAILLAASIGHADPPTSPTAEQIQNWIRDLDSSAFRTRDEAANKLRQAGPDAALALAKAAKTGSAEVADRALRLLGEMADGPDPKAEAAARRQLRRLADGESRAATDARTLLNRKRSQILTQLLAAGAAYDEHGSEITRVDLDNAAGLPSLMPLLKEFPELESLSISNRKFTDAEAKHLSDLPSLRDLNLFESNISDEGLKHLTGLKNLRWLPMGHTRVTDSGLKVISEMTQLEYVGVRGNKITDAGLVHLKALTGLKGLNLSETKVTDDGLKHVASLTRLQTLYLRGTAITDAGLEHLKELKSLRQIYLLDAKSTDVGRTRLAEAIPGLEFPDLPMQ